LRVVTQVVEKFPAFMEPEGSVPCHRNENNAILKYLPTNITFKNPLYIVYS